MFLFWLISFYVPGKIPPLIFSHEEMLTGLIWKNYTIFFYCQQRKILINGNLYASLWISQKETSKKE
ncbi:MAG: hypothetical protein A2374_02580 [Candidatus Moranbacteria bacterium RIFOXYB1_FULL_44_23]|nr:MAG: hypothetical protein A2407_03360 [Candidatus Moranbacteria bacterium RIFOXYC1_FULL_44_8]OGI39932.1 MAG: hypothetical protein A2374_02580 [Candidatus Moranbacteria bacterium RIFOXYB1_FULL_44_23]OGI41361.1 MAG: hypothetical protein A2593_01280 [Candidatus Moranbacteria bacterium RIFOXYD1_FULL_44_9]HBB37303.1 hypothetical protein [Candidatus Moranbacteria bacterium]HBU25641.1 hypothetical protein [Candidatus Moranbacteria bacterium]